MPDLSELLTKQNRTALENAQLKERIDILQAEISNMRKLLDKTPSDGWIDYSAISTIVGWASFTYKHIYYYVNGQMVTVWFYLLGTSDNVASSFTLPVPVNAKIYKLPTIIRVIDDSTPSLGMAVVNSGSNLVTFYIDAVSSTFVATGLKAVEGWFVYQKAMPT